MNISKNTKNLIFFLLASTLITQLIAITLLPLTDPTEGRYAEIARQMVIGQDWIMPHLSPTEPFWGKPPFAFWVSAIGIKLFGATEFAARIGNYILGLGTLFITYNIAKRFCPTDAIFAPLATLMLATTVLFTACTGFVNVDISLTFALTIALYGAWRGLIEDCKSAGYFYFIGLAIGMLAKGPIALVLGGTPLIIWAISTGQYRKFFTRLPWATGIPLFAIISLPWFYMAEMVSPGFLEYFIIGEHYHRFIDSGWQGDLYGSGHAETHGMIILYTLAALLPSALIIPFALKYLYKNSLHLSPKSPYQNGHWLLVSFAIWPIIFFILPANILWSYGLPSFPAIIILLAFFIRQPKYQKYTKYLPIIALPTLIFWIIVSTTTPITAPYINPEHKIITSIQEENLLAPNTRLAYAFRIPHSAPFYHQTTPEMLRTNSDIAAALSETPNLALIVKSKHLHYIEELNTPFNVITQIGKIILIQFTPAETETDNL